MNRRVEAETELPTAVARKWHSQNDFLEHEADDSFITEDTGRIEMAFFSQEVVSPVGRLHDFPVRALDLFDLGTPTVLMRPPRPFRSPILIHQKEAVDTGTSDEKHVLVLLNLVQPENPRMVQGGQHLAAVWFPKFQMTAATDDKVAIELCDTIDLSDRRLGRVVRDALDDVPIHHESGLTKWFLQCGPELHGVICL